MLNEDIAMGSSKSQLRGKQSPQRNPSKESESKSKVQKVKDILQLYLNETAQNKMRHINANIRHATRNILLIAACLALLPR